MPGGGLPPPGVHPGTHPTGAYYQPGYGVPPLPTKSNRRGWIIGLSIVGAVLLLGCLCCGVFGFVGYRMINDNRHDARAQVKEYYSRLKHHDYNGAYRLLCDSTRADETRQVFTDRQNADPIDDYDVRSVAISGNDVSDFEAKVEEDRHSGASKTVRVDVTREHGDYRICP